MTEASSTDVRSEREELNESRFDRHHFGRGPQWFDGAIRADAEGGVNAFVAEQAKQPGEALLTLVQFDTEYEFLHRGVPVQQVPPYELVPRGMTALLDAVGRAINETGERLAKMKEEDRPGLVVFVVMTDGQENSSKEFSKDQIKQLITQQQDEIPAGTSPSWVPIKMPLPKRGRWESSLPVRPTLHLTRSTPRT